MNNKAIPIVAAIILAIALVVKYGPTYLPIPVVGPTAIQVVIVEEKDDRFGLPEPVLMAITSPELLKYCNAKGYPCNVIDDDIKPPKGKELPGFIKIALELAKEGGELPWLTVATRAGSIVVDEPLGSEKEMLETVKKYGGN